MNGAMDDTRFYVVDRDHKLIGGYLNFADAFEFFVSDREQYLSIIEAREVDLNRDSEEVYKDEAERIIRDYLIKQDYSGSIEEQAEIFTTLLSGAGILRESPG